MIKFLLGLVIGAGLLLLAGYLFATRGVYMGTKGGPLPMEQFIAHKAIEASIGKSSHDESPLQASEINLLVGTQIYRQNCADCHGQLDQPADLAKGLYPRPPQLLQPGEAVTDDPVGATYWVVKNGVRFSGMPSFEGKLTDEEIWKVSLILRNAGKLPSSVQEALR
jgi:thiosulfate dehydrogenase